MNTQPPSQQEALSQEELELARVVRALPGGEPPAALDALILKAATDAVASQSEKKSRWKKGLLGTSALWLGTAAASVLTIGLGWQVFQSMQAPIYELPAGENVSSKQEIDSAHKSDSVPVEIIPAREPAPTSAAPEFEQDAAADAAAPVEKPKAALPEMRERQNAARSEMADAMLAKAEDDKKDSMRSDEARDAGFAEQAAGSVAASPPAPAPVFAPPPPMPAIAASVPAESDKERKQASNTLEAAGNRMSRSALEGHAKVVPRPDYASMAVAEDAKLAPDLWLDVIRERVKQNDIPGAKASLKLFRKKHPNLPIPEELKPFLK